MSGLNVSASTVERVTEAAGQAVADRRAAGESIEPTQESVWPKDKLGRTTAYVSLDSTGVPQQGPNGKRSDGRMPWVGSVFIPTFRGNHRMRHVRYVSGLVSLEEFSGNLTGVQVPPHNPPRIQTHTRTSASISVHFDRLAFVEPISQSV